MARARKRFVEAQGAFGVTKRPYRPKPELEPADELPSVETDDGVPYERFGEDARIVEIAEGLQELRERIMWFGPSPFMVVLLKELLVKLIAVSDTRFLVNLGIEDIEDLKSMHEMSGSSIADYLEAALSSLPRETLVELGLVV